MQSIKIHKKGSDSVLTKNVKTSIEIKDEKLNERLNYDNDVFLKFFRGTEDEDSAFIRNTILERVIGIHPKKSTMLNQILDPSGHK